MEMSRGARIIVVPSQGRKHDGISSEEVLNETALLVSKTNPWLSLFSSIRIIHAYLQ